MKTPSIYMKRWLEANGRTRTQPGDSWYLNFARYFPGEYYEGD